MDTTTLNHSGMYHVTGRRLGNRKARRYTFCEFIRQDTTGQYRVVEFFQAWRNLTVRMLVSDIEKVVEA